MSGTLNGRRIRKNFKLRTEAVAERQELNIEYLNSESNGQTVWTTLTHEQNRDAIVATNMLKRAASSKPLSFAVDYFLQHYNEAAESKTAEDAIHEYLDERAQDLERGILSRSQEKSIRMEMNRMKRFFGDRLIDDVTADNLKDYLETARSSQKRTLSLKTWNNRRSYLSTFFKFCLSKKYVAENPVIDLPQYKVKKARGTAATLSTEEVEKFMHWLESYRGVQNKTGSWWGKPGCMVPYFALTIFAGIRPDWRDGEISKLREKDIRLDTGVVLIEPQVSKIHEKRSIKIQPNLEQWLRKYPIKEHPIITPHRFYDLLADVRKKFALPHDVMRHTYISMTVGAFRSVGDAALQAGNSEAIIRKHYLDLKAVEEADQFWSIVPKGQTLPEKLEKQNGKYVVSSGASGLSDPNIIPFNQRA